MNCRLLILLTLTIAALSACASDPSDKPMSTTLTVEPVASINLPYMSEQANTSFDSLVIAHLEKQPVYNQYFQQPGSVNGGVVVPCMLTERIGVLILVSRSDGGPFDNLPQHVHFDWRHPDFDNRQLVFASLTRTGNRHANDSGPLRIYNDEYGAYSDYLVFEKVDKKDGPWTVTASYLGKKIYEETFVLEGCR